MTTTMTHKQRVLKAIAGQPVDRLPVQIEIGIGYADRVAAHWHIAKSELDEYLGNDLIYVFTLASPEWFRFDPELLARAEGFGLIKIDRAANMIYDNWGVGHDRTSEWPWFHVHPLADTEAIKGFQFPDPAAPGITDYVAEVCSKHGDEYAILLASHLSVFERCWMLRGYDNFMMDLASDTGTADYLLDAVTDYQVGLAEHFCDTGIHCVQMGDDYGEQRGLVMSPRSWRRFFKPRLARIYDVYRKAGIVVMQHSCGNVLAIIDDLVEIGLEVLHPVQSSVMPIRELADRWGDRLAFFGGIDTQRLMPFGTPEEIDAAVHDAVEILGRHGKYIIAPSQHILSDTAFENIDALIAAARNYGMRPATESDFVGAQSSHSG
jgi:uroporphyrinogen decarboxylase